jgi:hypothetical protein
MNARDRVLGIGSFLLTLILAPVVAGLILGPVNRAGGKLNAPTRFHLIDFVWLLVQFQVGLGCTLQYIGVQYQRSFLMLLTFFSFAVLTMWVGAVSFLSRAGVRNSVKRGVFIVVLLPATLLLMVAIPLFPAACYLLETDPNMMALVLRLNFEIPRGTGLTVAIFGGVVMPVLGFLLNRVSAWIVRGATELSAVRQAVTA